MAEWVLSMILCLAKKIPETLDYQAKAQWQTRVTDTISGKRALIVGVGSIGRAIGRQLRRNGMEVEGVGRTARDGDRDFGHVFGVDELLSRLPGAGYVVLITPYTDQTHQLFGEAEFNAMQSHARFINLGRGKLVVEDALLVALTDGKISAAALDVFVEEPLPAESPFWRLDNCLVSPHMSAYYPDYASALARQFIENFARFTTGRPLVNVIDKGLGYAPSAAR
jgi:phosphoglycerate dehydrogenase-like enzyme